MKGGFLPAVAFVIAILMVVLTCGAYNLQVNTALQCRRAPVQRIVDGLTVRSLKPGDKGFKPCDCNARRQSSDREQSTKVSVVALTMALPATPSFPLLGPIAGYERFLAPSATLIEPTFNPVTPPPQFA